jgi:hypothetical protein
MVKLSIPAEVKITVKPTVAIPDYVAWERLPKLAWRELVCQSRRAVGSALNQFYYGGE